MGLGVAFAWGATDHDIGTGARMGPGYFPLLLGIALAAVGAVITFKSLVVETETGAKIGALAWKLLFFISLANLAFGLLLGGLPSLGMPPAGLIAGIYALTFIASRAAACFPWREVALLAGVLLLASAIRRRRAAVFIDG